MPGDAMTLRSQTDATSEEPDWGKIFGAGAVALRSAARLAASRDRSWRSPFSKTSNSSSSDLWSQPLPLLLSLGGGSHHLCWLLPVSKQQNTTQKKKRHPDTHCEFVLPGAAFRSVGCWRGEGGEERRGGKGKGEKGKGKRERGWGTSSPPAAPPAEAVNRRAAAGCPVLCQPQGDAGAGRLLRTEPFPPA